LPIPRSATCQRCPRGSRKSMGPVFCRNPSLNGTLPRSSSRARCGDRSVYRGYRLTSEAASAARISALR
jgi:hypothetical protein